jgi:hypothetical protein
MRADRLKQVMQQIDSSFDEKNLGMSKFSRFVTEAAQRGLLSLTKLENGQFEVGPPRAAGAVTPGEPATVHAVARIATPRAGETETSDRPRRSRRGGRGRDRDGRAQRPVAAHSPTPTEAEATPEFPADTSVAAAPAPNGDGIGSSGLRLTREDAFNLVRRAVSETGPARASRVRTVARELLGRDSESLSERNFLRILQDAHDANLIDLRRRGADYEVAPAAAETPVSEQLAAAEPPKVTAPSAPSMPTGMGARSAPSRGRGRGPIGARVGTPPANLLSVGVVETSRPAPEPIFMESVADLPLTGEDALHEPAPEPKARSARKRGGDDAKPRRGRKAASASGEGGDTPSPRRAPRKSRSKTASE